VFIDWIPRLDRSIQNAALTCKEVCKSKKCSYWLSDVKDLIYSLGFGNVWDFQNLNENVLFI
jgi:hypothetical protein